MKKDRLDQLRDNFQKVYEEEMHLLRQKAERSSPSRPISPHLLREGFRRGRPVIEAASPRLPTAVRFGRTTARFTPAGLVTSPPELRGMRATNIPRLAHDIVDDAEVERRQQVAGGVLPGQTFMGPKQAVDGLSRANPGLFDAVGRLWGSYMDAAYQAWIKGGMKGPRPTPTSVKGDTGSRPGSGLPNFDWAQPFTDKERKDKRKPRTIWSITEAIYASIPASRRWQDWMPFLQEMQRQINAAAESEGYVEPWHEIQVPGRAGRVLAKAQIDAMLRSVGMEEIIAGYRQKGKETRSRPSEDVPF